jgi:hypothetical protein
LAVIKHFLGEEWIEEHVSPQRGADGFLRVIPGQAAATQISTFKIVDFAELLYNLQDVSGLDACIDRIRRGTIEPTYAELDLGRMLHCGGIEFRFVEPQQKKGSDYDIEIGLSDGLLVCADAKCKVESTDFSVETVRRSLEKARTQFPKDRPSMIFLKIPDLWIQQQLLGTSLNDIAEQFLRGTGRIVAVKFYFSRTRYSDKALTHEHAFREISNPNNRFDPSRNWDMFAEPKASGTWNGMPARWERLLFFPNSGRPGGMLD